MAYIDTLAKINTGDFRDEIIKALENNTGNIRDKISDLLYKDMDSKKVEAINKWLRKEKNIPSRLLDQIIGRVEHEYVAQVKLEMEEMLAQDKAIKEMI